jgi:DNA-binding response OmpR family regulator
MGDESQQAKVLLVEDSPTQSRIIQGILSDQGFAVETANDGQIGYDKFCSSEFDLVVSDVIMPGLSGYELCRKIKQLANGKHTPVILLTALGELKDLIDGLRSGADNFISKPVEPDYLISRIKSTLADREQPAKELCDPKTGTCFLDQTFIKSLDRKRILDYLVSTFDDFLRLREGQSQQKFAEAQRFIRLLQQQELRAQKLSETLIDTLMTQDDDLLKLLSFKDDSATEASLEIMARMQTRSKAVHKLVSNLSELLTDLQKLTSETAPIS